MAAAVSPEKTHPEPPADERSQASDISLKSSFYSADKRFDY